MTTCQHGVARPTEREADTLRRELDFWTAMEAHADRRRQRRAAHEVAMRRLLLSPCYTCYTEL